MVLIDVLDETVTLVTPVLLKVAVFVGTLGGVQLPGVFQSLVAPSQVASWAWAVFGTRIATALKQTLASSAARLKAVGAAAGAIRIALPRIAARGAAGAAARVVCERPPYERIPQPLRAARAALPPKRPLRPADEHCPRGQRYGRNRVRSIRGGGSWCGLPPPVAFSPRRLAAAAQHEPLAC